MDKQRKLKSFVSGSQIFFHYCRMLVQMNKMVGKWILLVFLLISGLWLFLLTPHDVWSTIYYLGYAKLSPVLKLLQYPPKEFYVPYHGKFYLQNIKSIWQEPLLIEQGKLIFRYLIESLIFGFICSAVLYAWFTHWLTKKGIVQRSEKFIRGATLEPLDVVKKRIKQKKIASDLNIEGLPLVKNSELQHMVVHGTTGAGKTQLLMDLLDQLNVRKNDTVILMDQGGIYTQHYFNEKRGDVILGPIYKRCAAWDLWTEAITLMDFNSIAKALIPERKGNYDPSWVIGAQTIFAQTAYRMRLDKDRCLSKLIYLLLKSPLPILEKYLEGSLAAPLLSSKSVKMAVSYRAILTVYTQTLQFLEGMQGKSFSIRQWIHQKKKGWLFMTANELHAESFEPLMSMWLSQATKQLLSLKKSDQRRIWFIIDELDCYHYLKQLVMTLPRARKYGGCFVIGMQSYAQIQDIYGIKRAEVIFDLLNTRFFFRSKLSALAKFVSEELGTQEINQFRENLSYGADTIRDGISSSHQRTTQTLIHYIDITKLENLDCLVQLPGDHPITKLTLTYKDRAEVDGALDEKADFGEASTWQPSEEKQTDQSSATPNTDTDIKTPDPEIELKKTEHTEKQPPENAVPEKEGATKETQKTQAAEKSNEWKSKQTDIPAKADVNQTLNQDADHHHSSHGNEQEKEKSVNDYQTEICKE